MCKLRLRDITPEEKQRFAICAHEAGHAVVATVFGDTVGTVELTPHDPKIVGQCTLAAEQFAGINTARIAYAGPYTEAFWRHGGPPTSSTLRRVLTASCREDDKIVRESGDPRPGAAAPERRAGGASIRPRVDPIRPRAGQLQDHPGTALAPPVQRASQGRH